MSAGAARDPDPGVDAQIGSAPTTAFGKYQLFASLGRGGMADVFLSVARGQMGFNKLAVIKRLRQALAEELAFRTMFLDEARLAARLSHPNIVHTYEVGEQGGVYFIAMEYLEGQSLNKILKETRTRDEPIEPEVSVRIVADALCGLHYAHTLADYDGRPLGIIHRDVSPHNIIVTYDGHTKLVDFGIAKAALSSTETEVGVLKGKVAYMSPEQAMGGRIDQRADIFAMGIVLWELLARQRLMTGENAANTLHKLMNEPIPRVSDLRPDVDATLDLIVAKSLEKDPDYRFQSAAEMRDALEAWLRDAPLAARQEEVSRKMIHLFARVREEVQRQVQRHMSLITQATNTQELQALTAESIHRMEQSGANVTGRLLRLGPTGGSGSGIIPNFGMGSHPSKAGSASSTSPAILGSEPTKVLAREGSLAERKERGRNVLLLVIAVGFFLLAGLLVVVVAYRDARRGDAWLAERPPSTLPSVVETRPHAADSVPLASDSEAPAPVPALVATAGGSVGPKVGSGNGTVTAPRNPPTSPRPPVVAHTAPSPPPSPSEDKDPGFLTISVYPWAKVSEGARVLCAATPCSKIPLSPGPHTLILENAEQGTKQTIAVAIKSGETTARAIGLK